jgi:hypothetical protein
MYQIYAIRDLSSLIEIKSIRNSKELKLRLN